LSVCGRLGERRLRLTEGEARRRLRLREEFGGICDGVVSRTGRITWTRADSHSENMAGGVVLACLSGSQVFSYFMWRAGWGRVRSQPWVRAWARAAVGEAVGAGEAAARDDAVRKASTGDELSGGATGVGGGCGWCRVEGSVWRAKAQDRRRAATVFRR
jgi:hypothetical protein